jgi:hypothetical protein
MPLLLLDYQNLNLTKNIVHSLKYLTVLAMCRADV